MGCGLSDLQRSRSKSNRTAASSSSAAVGDDTTFGGGGASREKNKLKITRGNEVRLLQYEPRVIFIFGGPGSKKGTIVNELIRTFGFTLINAEVIILHKLVNQLGQNSNSSSSASAVKVLLRDKPELVSLDWVMHEIIKQLDANPKGLYLVDILPNLKVLLKLDGVLLNVPKELHTLEAKYPVSFVINLEKTLLKKPSFTQGNPKDKPKSKSSTEEPTQSDEADSNRTEKRLSLYANAVKPFIDYFRKSEKIVSIDSSGGMVEPMWAALRDFLKSIDMNSRKAINTVIYFAFNAEECNTIREMFVVNSIAVTNFMGSKSSSMQPDKVFRALCNHIDGFDCDKPNFLVDMTGFDISVEDFHRTTKRKPVLFFDVTNSVMKKYMETKIRNVQVTKEVKTVVSTENEVYLFPKTTNSKLCKHIAWCFSHYREN